MGGRRPILSSLLAAARTRAWLAVLLAIYALPALVLPAVHIVSEEVETIGCAACASPSPAPQGRVSVRQECTPDAPCSDPNHHHHSHPYHRADHCSICSNIGTALLAAPGPGVSVASFAGVSTAVLPASGPEVRSAWRTVEQARGPPLPRSV